MGRIRTGKQNLTVRLAPKTLTLLRAAAKRLAKERGRKLPLIGEIIDQAALAYLDEDARVRSGPRSRTSRGPLT
jgi:hypothetical protein